jgi:hypothetical protein
MKIDKERNQFGLKHRFMDEENNLVIMFGGNGDLYWTFSTRKKDPDNITILITKENYQLYVLFEDLFNDIKDINIFDDIKVDKDLYRVRNAANYHELFDEETSTITWYSEDTIPKDADYLKIVKKEDCFIVSGYVQEHMKEDKGSHMAIIRFTNSGSRYYPFNILFMKMYNNLSNIDDVNEHGHQIHMAEYLHEKTKTKVKNI